MRSGRALFLPLFFAVLVATFVAAIIWRATSYSPRRMPESAQAVRDTIAPPDRPDPVDTATTSTGQSQMPGQTTSPQTEALAPGSGAQAAGSRPPAEPGAAEAPSPPASLLSRIVAPIVNAFTAAPPQTSQSQKTPGSSADQRGTASQSQSRGNESTRGDQTSTTEKDPSSDAQPPQLLSIGFNPPQVQDGEATQLIVQATDDLSGIRTISGTVVGPSGAAQGFACQREGEADRYGARVAVPKDAADGVWRVNYLALTDFASNTLTLAGAQVPQTASFRVVSSRPDAQGPTLRAVWVDRQAMRAGEKNTVFVDAEDDKSGLGMISGVFVSPSKHARVGFVCRANQGPWPCEFAPPECVDCGDWKLEQLQLQDKANNMTTVRADNPIVAQVLLNIAGERCDAAPPSLQSLVLDRNAVTNTEETAIGVTAFASDDACGVLSVSGQVTGPSTAGGSAPRLYFSFSPSGDSQMWNGRIVVPRLAAKGTWRVTWIQVLDRGHNLKTYSAGDPALGSAMFNVQ